MDNQNNNNNGKVIRSKALGNNYESLDDDYTKEDIQRERNLEMMNAEMEKMNNVNVPEVQEEVKDNNFFSNIKNKGNELINKVRGDRANLSSSELRKMDLQNKMGNSNIPNNQPMQQQMPQQMPQQAPVQNQPMNMPNQQVNNMPSQPVNNIPNQQVNNKVNNNRMVNSRNDVFNGLPNNNQQKKGFLSNFFHKGNNNAKNAEVVEPWMMNQPLSAQSLGVSQNEIKKEVEVYDDNSKYFNASADTDRVKEDNRLRPENFAKPLFERKVKPGKELEKKKNGTLLRYYFGSNYDTVSMGVFSISGLLFGGLYLISNKVVLIGLLIFAIQMYLICFVPWQSGLIVYAIIALALAFLSNPLIMFIANNKIKLYRSSHPKFVEEQLVAYVQKKKKSYSGLAVLILLVTLGVTSYMFVVNHYKFSGPIGIGYKYIEKLYSGSKKSEVAKIEYDDSINVNDYFTFTLDEGFKKDGVVYKFTTVDQGENNYCSFSFRKVKNYNDANSLLQAVKSLNKANGKVETEEINGIIYSKFILNKDNGKHTYLSVRHKETIFLIDYFSGKDTAQNVCDNMLEDIKGSLVKVGESTEEKK